MSFESFCSSYLSESDYFLCLYEGGATELTSVLSP